jgi:hypothetical protein
VVRAKVEAKAMAAEASAAEASAAEALAVEARVEAKAEALASHAVKWVIVPTSALRVAEAAARAKVKVKVAHSLADSGRKAIAPTEMAAAFRTTDLGQLSKDDQGSGEAASRA